jgi:hypothetical protein
MPQMELAKKNGGPSWRDSLDEDELNFEDTHNITNALELEPNWNNIIFQSSLCTNELFSSTVISAMIFPLKPKLP